MVNHDIYFNVNLDNDIDFVNFDKILDIFNHRN